MIHTANPVEHANNAMMQASFINPVHHASVDLSGHNLVNAHQASGMLNMRSLYSVPVSTLPPTMKQALLKRDYRHLIQKNGSRIRYGLFVLLFLNGMSLRIIGECCV